MALTFLNTRLVTGIRSACYLYSTTKARYLQFSVLNLTPADFHQVNCRYALPLRKYYAKCQTL
jgi:hypothetical protein